MVSTTIPKLLSYTFSYIATILVGIFAFSQLNPLYSILHTIYNFEKSGQLVAILVQTGLGFFGLSGTMIMFSTFGICLFLIGYSIGCLFVWTLFLLPNDDKIHGSCKLRCGINFDTAIKMYNDLRVMTIVQSEFFREFISPCMHHVLAVVMATGAVYSVLSDVSIENRKPIWFIVTCLLILGVAWSMEFYSICMVAKVGVASRMFLSKMRRMKGNDTYWSEVLKSMLPNAINLELFTSVDSIKNGIGMKYFLNFLDRVTDYTVALFMTNE